MTRNAIAALASCGLLLAAAGGVCAERANSASDAPESRPPAVERVETPQSYPQALQRWRSAEDINGWIGVKYDYDMPRALRLSETQRNGGSEPIAIHSPETFFGTPVGVCVDLARFAVETLRVVDPGAKPAYLMIEFAPVTIAGNTLRRHWLASFERGGQRYFFADSKRPGVLSGPYASAHEFLQEYARYRGREVVSYREVETYERRKRSLAAKQGRPGVQ